MIATKFNLKHRIQTPTWQAYDMILYETLKDKGFNSLTAQQFAKLAAKGTSK